MTNNFPVRLQAVVVSDEAAPAALCGKHGRPIWRAPWICDIAQLFLPVVLKCCRRTWLTITLEATASLTTAVSLFFFNRLQRIWRPLPFFLLLFLLLSYYADTWMDFKTWVTAAGGWMFGAYLSAFSCMPKALSVVVISFFVCGIWLDQEQYQNRGLAQNTCLHNINLTLQG